jgi:hypothetical protein
MQQMGHGTMLDADGRPDETRPPRAETRLARDGRATGAQPAGRRHTRARDRRARHAGYFRKTSVAGWT